MMRKSASWAGVTLLASVAGCGGIEPGKLAERIKPSVVLITYGDRAGHGSGFFVDGAEDVCTVLTAAHVATQSEI